MTSAPETPAPASTEAPAPDEADASTDAGPAKPGLDPSILFKDTTIAGDPAAPVSCDALCGTHRYGRCRIDTQYDSAGQKHYYQYSPDESVPYSLIKTCAELTAKSEPSGMSKDYTLKDFFCNCAEPDLVLHTEPTDARTCDAVCKDKGLVCNDQQTWLSGATGGTFPWYDDGSRASSAYPCATKPPGSYKGYPISSISCGCAWP